MPASTTSKGKPRKRSAPLTPPAGGNGDGPAPSAVERNDRPDSEVAVIEALTTGIRVSLRERANVWAQRIANHQEDTAAFVEQGGRLIPNEEGEAKHPNDAESEERYTSYRQRIDEINESIDSLWNARPDLAPEIRALLDRNDQNVRDQLRAEITSG